MTTAVRRRIAHDDDCEDVQRKILRITESHSTCTQETSSHKKDHFLASVVSCDFGPSKLNLYLYVAEESHFLWTKAKDMFILKPDREPKKSLLLFHERELDLKSFCWKQFEFDSYSTSCSSVERNSSIPTDMVCIIAFSKSFWKNMSKATLETLKDSVREVKTSHIFVLTDSNEDKLHAVKFCKKSHLCHKTHVLQTESDKSFLYETMYEILEKQLSSLVSDLKARTTTRLVQSFTSELDLLLEKLQSRKNKHHSPLSKQCIEKIKSGNEFGIVGHRLCGNVLYIFEDGKIAKDGKEMVQIKKSIEETFKGDVYYRSIEDVLSPHADSWSFCGGPIININNGNSGTLGIFGELKETKKIVALSSGHVFSKDQSATVPSFGNIGVCIWPLSSDPRQNIHNVSVIRIDLDQQNIDSLLKELILNEKITVGDIPIQVLGHRRVFKYGASTGRTDGRIGVVSDFKLYGEDVMTILPDRSGCPTGLFSKKGDSGAILLTRYDQKFYGIGVIYGGGMELPEFKNIREESIAVFLKQALDRFTNETKRTIVLDKM